MKLHSAISCAAFCVLTTAAFAQSGEHVHARPEVLGSADPSATTHFSVYFPLTNKAALEQLVIDQTNPASPRYHQWLTPAQFKAQYGPDPKAVAKVKRKLESAGFTIVGEHTQNIEVEGAVSSVETLLSARLEQVDTGKGEIKFGLAEHRFTLPAELASAGAMIPSFAPHLAAHVHSERLAGAAGASPIVRGAGAVNQRLSSAYSYYYANDMAESYAFPAFNSVVTQKVGGSKVQMTGAGATIGIVISSSISQDDVNAEFSSTVSAGAGLTDVQAYIAHTTVPIPVVTVETVNGGSGPFNPNSEDAGEASLDTQMSLGTAPGAKEILYDIPSLSDANIIAAYSQINEENKVDVVSSSFGECENDFQPAANGGTDYTYFLETFHSLFMQGNAQGITFVASSGDNGAAACLSYKFDRKPQNGTDYVLGVENPASDPAVTGVGGTNLAVSPTPTADDATYASENADFDPRLPATFSDGKKQYTVGNNTWGSGGGYSVYFSKPSYQNLVKTGSNKARAVPDVSLMMGGCPGDADLDAQNCQVLPRSAAIVFIGGYVNLLIGTSSSAPQFAGVLALDIELNGQRLGNVNPQLYTLSALQTAASKKTAAVSQFYHRDITGNNNGYTVIPDQAYSTVLGNGTLIVKNFLQIPTAAPAGAPNTASNP